eukprot:CAMPEP_0174745684 /NCGR_PEP_ID=MMETSP1094-20130205/87357_1 /TAXON_ID=156173 /ORGANISM="Chrysochromulina brevifilum, Strain UTEX LB 985" /LENGTH=58 /DNA_ID=CAMNT_0015950263 /DNA_START=81 /DNA_END=257 /DNA_ORIENTATION=-
MQADEFEEHDLNLDIIEGILTKLGTHPADSNAWEPGEWESCLEILLEAGSLPSSYGLY